METSIIVPAYNEEGNLSELMDNLIAIKLENYEIIIVNDNSSDKTASIAESYTRNHKNVSVVHRKEGKNGMGAALKEGTALANGKYIIWVMGDNSDDLKLIPNFIAQLKNNNADMIFGSRYIKDGSYGDMERFKASLSLGYTLIARMLFNIKVHDITNAFRAFKKDIFTKITLESDNYAISPEFAIKSQLMGYKLGEIPTVYKNRKAGQTKFKFIKMGIDYCKLFKYKLIK